MTSKRIFLGFLAILVNVVCNEAMPSSRMLGGADTSAGQYPFVASVRVNGSHTCSGTIINNNYIITAAHCVPSESFENSQVTVRVGSINQFAGGEIAKIESLVEHPSFGNFLHDISLLKLDQSLTFSDRINKIPLATTEDVIEDDTPLLLTGWGLQESGSSPYKLQHLSMSALNQTACDDQAGYGYDSVLCMAHPEKTGICQGDAGAGVVSDSKLVGVASFAFGSCGSKYPDIASKISYYNKWITSVIG